MTRTRLAAGVKVFTTLTTIGELRLPYGGGVGALSARQERRLASKQIVFLAAFFFYLIVI